MKLPEHFMKTELEEFQSKILRHNEQIAAQLTVACSFIAAAKEEDVNPLDAYQTILDGLNKGEL